MKKNNVITLICTMNLLIIGCSYFNPSYAPLRDAVGKYLTALQKGNIEEIYHLELPEFKNRVSLEEYKAHDLLGLADSTPVFNYKIKKAIEQGDTVFVRLEINFPSNDSTVVDSLKVVLIQGKYYIPTYSTTSSFSKK